MICVPTVRKNSASTDMIERLSVVRDGGVEGQTVIRTAGTEPVSPEPPTGETFAMAMMVPQTMNHLSGRIGTYREVRMTTAGSNAVTNYFPSGALESQYTEVNGKIEGCRRRWHPNGQVFSETEFTNGIANGQTREWSNTSVPHCPRRDRCPSDGVAGTVLGSRQASDFVRLPL